MADLFAKLMQSILDSSVWCEDDATLRVWVTLLAMKDKDGYVGASLPGLANRARKTLAETQAALEKFMQPDPYSRTKTDDGRRIREVDGGWLVINAAMYRDKRHEGEKARKRKYYHAHKPAVVEDEPTPPPVAVVTPAAENPKPKRERKKPPAVGAEGYTVEFELFWNAYPTRNPGSKIKAFDIWTRHELASVTALLVDDVTARAAKHRQWREEAGRFIPHATTYLNGRQWQAPIDTTPPRRPGARADVEQANQSVAAGWEPPPTQGEINVE